jgi:Zn-dependent protease with chaperone function
MKKILPLVLISAALGVSFLLSKRGGASRESLLPLSRAVAEQEKGLDRAAGAAFPLSPDEERRIGEGLDAELQGAASAPGGADAAAAARWREIGETAARSSLVTRFRGRYVFRATPEGGLNAFAVPGGFVYGTLPLIKRLAGDDDALLFVLGHEIGHVELGHCADAYRLRAGARDPITAAAGAVLSVGRLFAEMHFSSTQELEADAFAVRLLRSLHRDPRAGLRVFDALGLRADVETKRDPGAVAAEGAADYFHTHPGSWERRAALEREIGESK